MSASASALNQLRLARPWLNSSSNIGPPSSSSRRCCVAWITGQAGAGQRKDAVRKAGESADPIRTGILPSIEPSGRWTMVDSRHGATGGSDSGAARRPRNSSPGRTASTPSTWISCCATTGRWRPSWPWNWTTRRTSGPIASRAISFVNQALSDAGVPLLRVDVGETYDASLPPQVDRGTVDPRPAPEVDSAADLLSHSPVTGRRTLARGSRPGTRYIECLEARYTVQRSPPTWSRSTEPRDSLVHPEPIHDSTIAATRRSESLR